MHTSRYHRQVPARHLPFQELPDPSACFAARGRFAVGLLETYLCTGEVVSPKRTDLVLA